MSLKAIVTTTITIMALGAANVSLAGEYDDQCAMGLASKQHFDTDCSTNLEIDGKTYCFGNQEAKTAFLEDTKVNIEKATAYYKTTK